MTGDPGRRPAGHRPSTTQPPLARHLGTADAVTIGLGSMVGAGVFAVFAPAAEVAGSALLIGLVVAAAIAYANATSSAQLAAQYPSSGGTYVYGRERLSPGWGFAAGWGFVIGKTASCAAMALTFAAYAAPDGWHRPTAVGAMIVISAITYRGVTRTARATRVILAVSLTALVVVALAGLIGTGPDVARVAPLADAGEVGWYAVLQSAGLLFFAFAGYARIATLGEEVRDPARTIPRAVQIALALAVAIYALMALTVLLALGAGATAGSPAPLAVVVETSGWSWAEPLVRLGACAAALGALLGLCLGVSRTTLAMARDGELPRWLAAVHPRHLVPHRAELALTAVVCGLVLVVDLRSVIGFSSFGVLFYYLVANLAAHTQQRDARRFPRALQVFGAVGCVVLMATLPAVSVAVGGGVLALGLSWRVVRLRWVRP
ncbi:APC family permease [Nocardioides sp. R-C-SC26]|uniref:APC family permease n=1 Tax=Nocardioides sp. R-C-SC26 TaxID=2870414 RepID=UPI001E36300B|nr:APC family permease [Nocardioides sp. R-C-SC26]